MTRPKFYSLRNYFSVAFHYAAAAGLAVASYTFAQPWAIIAAAVLTAPSIYVFSRLSKEDLSKNFVKHDKTYPFSPQLGKMVEELYKKSGLKSKDYPLYDFEMVDKEEEKEGDKKNRLSKFNLMQKIPNAAALVVGSPVIIISKPLLMLLNSEEEKAVLAHEFAHIASKHGIQKLPHKVLLGASKLANGLTMIQAALSAGVLKFVCVMAASIFTGSYLKKHSTQTALLMAKDEDLSVKDIYKKKKINRNIGYVAKAVSLSGLSYINPAYPTLWLTAKSIGLTSQVIEASLSRSAEYQADKGAVALDANPLALIGALRKIDALMERSRQHAWGEEPFPQPGMLRKAWKKATSTHPTLENRISRLSEMARQSGYSDEVIGEVVSGPINLSEAEDIPYDVIKQMAMAL